MKRPWQIWFLFCTSLAVAVLGMTWLTVHTLNLDQAETLARRQAELEERVSVALWRMDSMLTPLVGQEAARPYNVYQAFELPAASGKGNAPRPTVAAASPLLNQPSEYVLLHFELRNGGQTFSPQCPAPQFRDLALTCGATPDNLETSHNRLSELTQSLSHDQLLAMLPDRRLPNPETLTAQNPQVVDAEVQQQYDGNFYVSNAQTAQPVAQARRERFATAPQSSAPNSSDYWQRGARYQNYAQQELIKQQFNRAEVPAPAMVSEGVSRPLWIDGRLLLARKVQLAGQQVVQGCWLNWDKIRTALLDEIDDLNLNARLVPRDASAAIIPSRMLAGLPIELQVARAVALPESFTPTQIALLFAWSGLALAAVSVAVLLTAVVALSERRAAFVSAVTHELRTPLTTFRMYSEMLASGMVDDPEQRRSYFETLRSEADRLTQLVANVLSYARLERTGKTGSLHPVSLSALLDRMQERLAERAATDGMALQVSLDDALRDVSVQTDASVVEQILFNLVDNACKYGASGEQKRITLDIGVDKRQAVLRLADDGPGIPASGVRRLFRPFSKSAEEAAESAPGVGLGLALCQRLARQLGGELRYQPRSTPGACFVLKLPLARGA